jgi:hypothetical protein
MRPLVIPPPAQRDETATQLISAWAAEKGLHCTLNIGIWHDSGRDEPESWGILLSDLARHAANALQERYGLNSADTLARIHQAIDIELLDPSSDTTGAFHHGHT